MSRLVFLFFLCWGGGGGGGLFLGSKSRGGAGVAIRPSFIVNYSFCPAHKNSQHAKP